MIDGEIAREDCLAVGFWRDNHSSTALIEFCSKRVVGEAFVADEGVKGCPLDQWRDPDTVMALARKQDETGQMPSPSTRAMISVVRPPRAPPIA